MKTFDAADRTAFSKPHVQKAFLAATGTPRGQQWDTRLILSPWDFRLEEILKPGHLWQSDRDHNASPAMGRYLERVIPNNRMTFMPGMGHISIMVNHAADIPKTLTQ